jgi:catechol 2,3-dioxygenase-like lactoylglutathione lyase family enzyme
VTVRLAALSIDAHDPERLADFWGAFLGRERTAYDDGVPTLAPVQEPWLELRFPQATAEKTARNPHHLEVVGQRGETQGEVVSRALALGAAHADVGQLPEEDHVVLADPEGNEFCVIPSTSTWLSGCGFEGSLACDGTADVGRFWAAALEWPLVWEEGEETAVQHPEGGTKIAWGGPPLMDRQRKDWLHLDLATSDVDGEVSRLIELGAMTVSGTACRHGVAMLDPDGHPFCLFSG